MADKRSLEDYAEDHAEARFAENQEIARSNRVLRSALDAEKTKAQAAHEEVETLQRELDLFTLDLKVPRWLKRPKADSVDHGTLVAFLSDTHFGEVVNPAEMDGYNAYNLEIADLRTQRFFTKTVEVARKYLAGVEYDGIVLALGGDLVSGDIHDELAQTNEVSTYESVLWAVPRLVAGVEMLASEFGKVHVVSAPGNHGRDSKKPRHKGRSAHNADTLIGRLVAQRFEGREDVTFEIPKTLDVRFHVYDTRFTMEHGDALHFNGSSEIGSLGPVKRGTLRKRTQAQAEGHPFDYLLVGHFHQYVPAASQGFVMNGSLKGYDEYARSGKFTPEQAQQALAVVTPQHGITVQAPVFVADRKAEGW